MYKFFCIAILSYLSSFMLPERLEKYATENKGDQGRQECFCASATVDDSILDLKIRDIGIQISKIQKETIDLTKASRNTILLQKENLSSDVLAIDENTNLQPSNKELFAVKTIVECGGSVIFVPSVKKKSAPIVIVACQEKYWHGNWSKLKLLKDINNLQIVILEDEEVPNDVIAYLAGINDLTALRISSSEIDNDGLKYLTKCKKLNSLELDCPQITINGLRHLRKISSLSRLDLLRPDNVTHNAMALCFEDIKGLCCVYHDYTRTKIKENETAPGKK